ncbi:unnamed protein product [Darwinula stevensoni]|uniref:Uncharacterized protein n=1 Tax=Darwinula stevensoni TaxID=69355 RepID=A0A7R8XGK2_9CRUS|nr:unnamed protein product [Darwinula stevensoni]CAG0896101.1 unnamed protein product [Darwinula stevensoni]
MRHGLYFLFFLLWDGRLLEGSNVERQLMEDLLTNYIKVLPVETPNTSLVVSFRLILFRIIELDERNQALVTNVEVVQRWNDAHLKWNASDYGGIKQTMIPYDSIWTPDIILYNSAAMDYSNRVLTTNAIVSSTGDVTLLTAAIFRSVCDVDVSYFPFDIQNCTMRFMSWTQDETRIQMKLDHNKTIELKTYIEDEEFTLESYDAKWLEVEDPCCPKPFSTVDYVIQIKRRAAFFVINYVLPMIDINVIGMTSPLSSGEKVTLGISTMLTIIFFLMSIRDVLPPSENFPLIGKFYFASICLVSMEVALAILTLFLHHLKDIRVQKMCRMLAKLSCMKEPRFRNVKGEPRENKKGKMEFTDGLPPPFLYGDKIASSRRPCWKSPVERMKKELMTGTIDTYTI